MEPDPLALTVADWDAAVAVARVETVLAAQGLRAPRPAVRDWVHAVGAASVLAAPADDIAGTAAAF